MVGIGFAFWQQARQIRRTESSSLPTDWSFSLWLLSTRHCCRRSYLWIRGVEPLPGKDFHLSVLVRFQAHCHCWLAQQCAVGMRVVCPAIEYAGTGVIPMRRL